MNFNKSTKNPHNNSGMQCYNDPFDQTNLTMHHTLIKQNSVPHTAQQAPVIHCQSLSQTSYTWINVNMSNIKFIILLVPICLATNKSITISLSYLIILMLLLSIINILIPGLIIINLVLLNPTGFRNHPLLNMIVWAFTLRCVLLNLVLPHLTCG